MATLSWQLIHNLRTHQQLVQDRAELQHVKYGMLNADRWVEQVSVIVEKKVRELELRGEQRESMKRALERMLDTLLTEADRYIRAQHTSGDWWDRTTGRVKEGIRNSVMDIDTVKAGIPEYAEQILLELENPEPARNRRFSVRRGRRCREFDVCANGRTLFDAIRQRYRCTDSAAVRGNHRVAPAAGDARSRYLVAGVLLCAALMLWAVHRSASPGDPLPWLLLSFSTMLLLACAAC
jgi:hypothetical protein